MNPASMERLKSVMWFVVKVNLLAVPMYLIFVSGFSVPQFQEMWAAGLRQSLESFGYETALDGRSLAVKSGASIHQIDFSWDSTGWKSMYALFMLVFASGIGTTGSKLRFLAFGIPLMAMVNMLRVVSTVLLSLNLGFENFSLIHDFLWSGVMVALTFGVWWLLFYRTKK